MRKRTKTVMARVGLLASGLVLSMVLLELALQIGALFVVGPADLPASPWATEGRRILCLGDSNTYGTWLQERERDAYPAQLRTILSRGDLPSTEVLNLGYPGTNSSRLTSLYPRFLEAFAPDIVIVMVGVNDFWTEPVPIEDDADDGGLLGFARRHSRLYKGYYMLQRRSQLQDLEFEENPENGFKSEQAIIRFGEHAFELGFTAKGNERAAAAAALRDNLHALVRLTESSPARLVLMTYPGRWEYYGPANREIRAVAKETGVPLVDLEQVFRPLCPRQECAEWLYRDQHPKAVGYERVAETIAERVTEWFR